MLSSCVIVGEAAGKPVFLKGSDTDNRRCAVMKVECDAAFRTPEGNIRKELFDVMLWRGIADECVAAVRKGTILAVRGHLSSVPVQQNGIVQNLCMIEAEKVVLIRQNENCKCLHN